MKRFVSRKTFPLPLIHLFPRVLAIDLDVVQAFHESVILLHAALPGGKFGEPFAEGGVEGSMLRLRGSARLFDQVFVSTEGNIFH